MEIILRPKIELTDEEKKALRIVRDMLVAVECDSVRNEDNENISALEEFFWDYIDHYRTNSPFITCVDFLSALLRGAGVEDENGELIKE